MNVAVIGSGTMGSGIAQVAAEKGCQVFLYDSNEKALEKSEATLNALLVKLVEKGKYAPEKKELIQQNIQYSHNIEDIKNVELVIEAIVEDLTIKKELYKTIESIVNDSCLIASNTSSLSITALAATLNKPERSIGLHFFNPAPLMQLVEIIPGLQTGTTIIDKAKSIITSWGKTGVVAKDTPGFIVNRIARPYYGEAMRILEEGIADVPTIDWAMESLGGFRMGPFRLMDYIGHDVNYAVSQSVFEAFYYDDRYKPSFTQKKLVEANYLGRKSGRGFYTYPEDSAPQPPNEESVIGRKIMERIVMRIINEAADAFYLNVASKIDIDLAMTIGVNYPRGPLEWADAYGIENCVAFMDSLYDTYHEDQYRCTVLLRKMADNKQTFFQKIHPITTT
jgi:3-hydroxybutyryl-CoA dehydrogenase